MPFSPPKRGFFNSPPPEGLGVGRLLNIGWKLRISRSSGEDHNNELSAPLLPNAGEVGREDKGGRTAVIDHRYSISVEDLSCGS